MTPGGPQRAPATHQPRPPAFDQWLADCERVTLEKAAAYKRQLAEREARRVALAERAAQAAREDTQL